MDNETKDTKKQAETKENKTVETAIKTDDKSTDNTGELDSDGFPKASDPMETPVAESENSESKSNDDKAKVDEEKAIKKYQFKRRYMSGKWIGWNAIINLDGKSYKLTITKPKIAEFLHIQSGASYVDEDGTRHFDSSKLINWILGYCAFAMPDGSIKTRQTLDDFDDNLSLFNEVSAVLTLALNSFSGN